MKGKLMAYSLTAAAAIMAAAVPLEAMAASSSSTEFELRKKVIGISGIMEITGVYQPVTRAQFAQMLVNASEYRNITSDRSTVSVFADVPKDNMYASYVRIAVSNEWMTGYLGGVFRPDQYITLQEAARGVLALLGYTGEDFTGDQMGGRMSLFEYLDLNDEIGKSGSETLTKEDCINLFYNLLKAEPKNGSGIYGSILGCELTSDGEINPLAMADSSLKGPKVFTDWSRFQDSMPFGVGDANFFVNGTAVEMETFKSYLNTGHLVVYYNPGSKTVWAYSEAADGESDRNVINGYITHIYYNSSDVMTPTEVELDDGTRYRLDSSEMQFAFSMYGTLEVGDRITLIYTISGGEDSETYTVIDYVDEDVD